MFGAKKTTQRRTGQEDAQPEAVLGRVIGVEGHGVALGLHLDAGRVGRARDVQRPDVQDDHAEDDERQQVVQREEAVERGVVGRKAAEQPRAGSARRPAGSPRTGR